jgi:uncharacterized coiled-coil protein SlyX
MQQDLLPRQMQPARCAWLPKETPRSCQPLMTQWTTGVMVTYRRAVEMGTHMREQLTALMKRLKDEQQRLLFAAAESATLPSLSTIQRVADIELNIAAIENTLAELQS